MHFQQLANLLLTIIVLQQHQQQPQFIRVADANSAPVTIYCIYLSACAYLMRVFVYRYLL